MCTNARSEFKENGYFFNSVCDSADIKCPRNLEIWGYVEDSVLEMNKLGTIQGGQPASPKVR